MILRWLKKNLDGCEDPRALGKGLSGDLAGAWRYRAGQYRIIADIQDGELLILVVEVGHSKDIYKKLKRKK